jgi:hypothetical protein
MYFKESAGYGCRCGYWPSGHPTDKITNIVLIIFDGYGLFVNLCGLSEVLEESYPMKLAQCKIPRKTT